MRKEMRESYEAPTNALKREQMAEQMSERNKYADRLLEKWEKTPVVGEGVRELREKNETKARNLAFVLQNEEEHLAKLTETQISSAFQTTPENVMRIVRLAYPNSVRGEIFLEWGMETARDSIYYLHPIYGKTKRGATAGGRILETPEYRYPTEIEQEAFDQAADGSQRAFTHTTTVTPFRPFTVKVLVNGIPVANDDGAGNIQGQGLAGTANYNSGVVEVTFDTAPTSGTTVEVEYSYDSEVSTNYGEIGSIELQLRDYQFRAMPKPLYISWSKMTELLLNTTLNIDAEESLIRGASDEFKKALDFEAVAMGWRTAKGHTAVEFDCKGAVGEPEVDRMNAFSKAIESAGDIMYDQLLRGGVTKMVGGPKAIAQIQLHSRFDTSNRQPKVGIYRVGSLDGIDVYKAPSSIIPNDQIMCVYRNELVPEDVAIAFGTLVPLYKTMTLEFKEFYKETGMAIFGDSKVLQPAYLQRIQLNNMQ